MRRLAAGWVAVLVLWASCLAGTQAHAEESGVRTLLMPGKLASAHAKEENNCEACHESFAKGAQDELCLECHEEVAADLDSDEGFHGRLGNDERSCIGCHSEHLGRDADISSLDRDRFDHTRTDYPLEGAHRGTGCRNCHKADLAWREAPTDCAACHREDDRHAGSMGDDCAACHRVTRWSEANFDHAKTDFTLDGKHEKVACAACHPAERYEDTPTGCAACHAIGDPHHGQRGDRCDSCHVVEGWKEIRFDHAKDTDFALRGRHAELRCSSCHHLPRFADALGTTCNDCHRSDDVHAGRNGAKCADCHDQTDWKRSRFDHARDGGFELRGAHADASCESCHTTQISKDSTPVRCVGCHKDDDVHRGAQGEECQACHGESAWSREVGFDHGLGEFPLLGMHATLSCESCHADQAYSETDSDCRSCHAQDDTHAGGLGDDCARCHNPAGWSFWRFDHDSATEFALDGAHADVACDACHTEPAGSASLRTDCYSCHEIDDRHDGQFGRSCERCHATDDFRKVQLSPRVQRGD